MNGHEKSIVHSSWVSYLVLWMPIVILSGFYLGIAGNGQRGMWSVVGMLLLLGVIGSMCLVRLRLSISSDVILYRGVIHAVQIPVADIASISGMMTGRERLKQGLPKGPGLFLRIETVSGKGSSININMKPFNRRELVEFFDAIKTFGIPLHLDDVVAATVLHS